MNSLRTSAELKDQFHVYRFDPFSADKPRMFSTSVLISYTFVSDVHVHAP